MPAIKRLLELSMYKEEEEEEGGEGESVEMGGGEAEIVPKGKYNLWRSRRLSFQLGKGP